MAEFKHNPITGELDMVNPVGGQSEHIQFTEMPTPGADYLNKIVQFTGATTASYTQGYFYKCVGASAERLGDEPEPEQVVTYSWHQWDVQPEQGGGSFVPMPRVTAIPSDGVYLPNVLYVLSLDGTARTITLSPSLASQTSEYHLFLTTGATAPTITWQGNIDWAGGAEPVLAANHTYEISIVEMHGVCKDWNTDTIRSRVTTIPTDGNYLPNTLYVLTFGATPQSVNLVAASGLIESEYKMIITTTAATNITWASGLTWKDGGVPVIEANHIYEVTIKENLAAIADWGGTV